MNAADFNTTEPNTWCPGCTNFGLLNFVKGAFADLVTEGLVKKENLAITSGVGCHAKIYDYINVNAFYGLHGRDIPIAVGIWLANPDLKVVAFAGDGDAFAEGMSHLMDVSRNNPDITVVVHNNQTFALTTGQSTPVSLPGFKGKTTPEGFAERQLQPHAVVLAAGGTFVARDFALAPELKNTLKQAIMHKGFSFVEVLQPCITFCNTTDFVREHIYRIEEPAKDFESAYKLATEWKYSLDENSKIPLGVFYQAEDKVYSP